MFLIVNLGLKSIRGIIFDKFGEQIYTCSFPVHTYLSKEKVEQDANEYKKLLFAILDNIHLYTNLISKLRGITVTTSSSCIMGVDENSNPITKVMLVSDKRSEEIANRIKNDDVFKRLPFQDKPFVSSSATIPKALWYKENEPDIFGLVKYWIGAGEYLNNFFTGLLFTDPLNASKSFYINGAYNDSLLSHYGVKTVLLPKVEEIGNKFVLQDALIQKYGFSKDCSFVLTTYDAVCAVVGSSTGDHNACDVSGTVTSVRVLCDEACNISISNEFLLKQHIPILNKVVFGASNNLGGGIIEWYKQAFFKDEDVNDDVYLKMENQAQKVKAGADGVFFLPYLLGERAPFSSPNASGTFFGLSRTTTNNEISRAVFESCAFVSKGLLDLIENENIRIESLTVSGGLARFDLINKIKADVVGKEVKVLDNFESTSLGALIFMLVALDILDYRTKNVSKIIKVQKSILPSTKNVDLYDKRYKLFKNVNTALTPIYDLQKTILQSSTDIEISEVVKNL